MNRFTRCILAASAALFAAASLQAQTKPSATATAVSDLSVGASLTFVKVTDQHFGLHFPSEGTASTGGTATGAAQWTGTTDVNNKLSVTFTLPTALTGAAGSVPYSCGLTSADLSSGGNPNEIFNPNAPYSEAVGIASTGSFNLALGNNGPTAADGCSVTLTGAKPGTYAGTITVTVAVL
jgi:hypothetical protein